MNTIKQSGKLAIGALVATIVAIVSFFLDFIPNSFYSLTGLDLLEVIFELLDYASFEDICFLLAFGATAASIITAAMGMKNPATAKITTIVSSVALVTMFISLMEKIDYAGIGFWLFIIAQISAIGLSVASSNAAKKEASSDTSNGYYTYDQPAKQLCPNCKGELEPGAAFCKYCGAYVNQN